MAVQFASKFQEIKDHIRSFNRRGPRRPALRQTTQAWPLSTLPGWKGTLEQSAAGFRLHLFYGQSLGETSGQATYVFDKASNTIAAEELRHGGQRQTFVLDLAQQQVAKFEEDQPV